MTAHDVETCTCEICQEARRNIATNAAAGELNLSKAERSLFRQRLDGAPEEIIRKFNILIGDGDRGKAWSAISKHFISLMVSPEHRFSGKQEEGSIVVGITNELKYAKEELHFASLKMTGVPALVSICVDEDIATRTGEWATFVQFEDRLISVFVDLPMSIIWGDLTYKQAEIFMGLVASFYTEEHSIAKILARQLAPLSRAAVDRIKSDIRSSEHQLEGVNAQISGLIQVIFEKSLQLRALESGEGAQTIVADIQRLMAGGAFTDLQVEGESILLTLKDVKITHNNYVYRMGDYRVTLNVRQGDVRAKAIGTRNLTDRQKRFFQDRPHPHLRADGPCLGSYANIIREHILNQRVVDAIITVRSFLASYNPASKFIEVEEFLPDRYYTIWMRNHEARPWETDDGLFDPGPSPTANDYSECFKASKANVTQTAKLRCLKQPFGEVCARCPNFQRGRDSLYEACFENSNPDTCMKCGDLNCNKLESAERKCLKVMRANLAEGRAQILGCVTCQYGRVEICAHGGDRSFENCWAHQKTKTENERACNQLCTVARCPHHRQAAG
jgi:hypothetical protein